MNFFVLFSFLFLAGTTVKCENILFFWAVSGTSHRITVWPLIEKLVDKGHNVTFFSPLPPKKPNPKVNEIVADNLMKDSGLGVDFLDARINGGTAAISVLWSKYYDFAINSCEAIMKDSSLVQWIKDSKYDLVVINAMFNDCGYGLAYFFKAPTIIYGTTHTFGWWSESFGYPEENYPEFQYHYPEDMTFLQSVHNAILPLQWQWNREWYMFPKVESTLRKGLNIPEMPSLSELESNVSLVFMNTHFSEEYPRSLPPWFVQIGGMHCVEDTKPLSEELEKFINLSNQGFIYFSFGTFATPESLPTNIVENIINAMGSVTEIQFLVRWTDNDPRIATVPKNVKVIKWVSQQDVLAHKKIRGFISHGGLLGTQEAVFHAVPTIVIPLFAEQDYNAERVQSRGRGLMVDIGDLSHSQSNLEEAVRELLRNSSYAENVQRVSKLFKDRPMKPADTALQWVEYVLRHRNTGTGHLRPIGLKKNWFQRRQLDIWGFIAGIFILLLCVIIFVIRWVVKCIFCRVKASKRNVNKRKRE